VTFEIADIFIAIKMGSSGFNFAKSKVSMKTSAA